MLLYIRFFDGGRWLPRTMDAESRVVCSAIGSQEYLQVKFPSRRHTQQGKGAAAEKGKGHSKVLVQEMNHLAGVPGIRTRGRSN